MKYFFLLALVAFSLFTTAYVGTGTNLIVSIKESVPFLNASSTNFHALVWQMPSVQSFTVDTNHSFNYSLISIEPASPSQNQLTNFHVYWRNNRNLSGFIFSYWFDSITGWVNSSWVPFGGLSKTNWSNYSYTPIYNGVQYWMIYANDTGSPSNWSATQPQFIFVNVIPNPPVNPGGGGGGYTPPPIIGQTGLEVVPSSFYLTNQETKNSVTLKLKIINHDADRHVLILTTTLLEGNVTPSSVAVMPNVTQDFSVVFKMGEAMRTYENKISILVDGSAIIDVPVKVVVNQQNFLIATVGEDAGNALITWHTALVAPLFSIGSSSVPVVVLFILVLALIGWVFGKFKKEGWQSAAWILAIFVTIFYTYVLYLSKFFS